MNTPPHYERPRRFASDKFGYLKRARDLRRHDGKPHKVRAAHSLAEVYIHPRIINRT